MPLDIDYEGTEWFLASVFDADGLAKMYVGDAQGGLPWMALHADGVGALTCALPLNLGQDGTGRYAHNLDGDIDDLAISRRALTHDEVLRLYRGGQGMELQSALKLAIGRCYTLAMAESDYVCMLCAAARPRAACPKHEDEPMMDTSDVGQLKLLHEEDSRDMLRIHGRWAALGGTIGAAAAFVVVMYGVSLGIPIEPIEYVLIAVFTGPVVLGQGVARDRFTPRFSKWTDADFGSSRSEGQ